MPLPESRRLIKAQQMRPLGSGAAFNIEDIERDCADHLARARRHAETIVAQAVAESAEIHRQGYEQGRREGEQSGAQAADVTIESRVRAMAAEQTREQLRATIPIVDELIETIQLERERWLTEWERSAVRLAAIIAEGILKRELTQRPELALEGIRQALQLASESPRVALRLHPLDLDLLNEHGRELLERLSGIGETTLTPDDGLARGGCRIETMHGIIDARIETQLARIVDELLGS